MLTTFLLFFNIPITSSGNNFFHPRSEIKFTQERERIFIKNVTPGIKSFEILEININQIFNLRILYYLVLTISRYSLIILNLEVVSYFKITLINNMFDYYVLSYIKN